MINVLHLSMVRCLLEGSEKKEVWPLISLTSKLNIIPTSK